MYIGIVSRHVYSTRIALSCLCSSRLSLHLIMLHAGVVVVRPADLGWNLNVDQLVAACRGPSVSVAGEGGGERAGEDGLPSPDGLDMLVCPGEPGVVEEG